MATRWMHRLSLLSITLLTINACTILPGSHMGRSADFPSDPLAEQGIAVRPITHTLVASLNTDEAQPKPSHAPANVYEYRIGPGDILNITVWEHPELTIPAGSMRSAQESGNPVHPDGTIFYPYVGVLKAAGKTTTELRSEITQRLDRYLKTPQVDVQVAAYRSQRAFVTGAVKQPGKLPISSTPLTLLDAINLSGGLDQSADWERVQITRDEQSWQVSLNALYQQGQLAQNLLLQDGDVIHVPRNDQLKVFVLGEVDKPSVVPMHRAGLSLAEALASGGGLNEREADASGIFVLRASPTPELGFHTEVYQLDARDATALVLADRFPLQARDVVYVTSAPLARWNRLISLLVPSVTAANLASEIESRSFSN